MVMSDHNADPDIPNRRLWLSNILLILPLSARLPRLKLPDMK